jgi:Domain of unknown function (DUF5134)
VGGPVWLSYSFAGAMLVVAGFCAGQIAVAHRTRRPAEIDSDGMHIVAGIAMAGMLVARLRIGSAGLWTVVFTALAVWFSWQAVRARSGAATSPWRCPQPATHLAECGAMLFMLFAAPAAGGRPAGMGMPAASSRWSFVSLLLAVFMLGYVVWLADRLGARPRVVAAWSPGGDAAAVCAKAGSLAPRCAVCCKITMGITMGYMLVLML